MRVLLIYTLLFAVMLPIVSPWGTIVHYQLNKDYIARVLCQNRDKPQLHCDGKCYLAKRLKAQQDKQDKETTERVQNMPLVQLFCEANITISFSRPEQIAHRKQFVYVFPQYDSPFSAQLRPPRFVV